MRECLLIKSHLLLVYVATGQISITTKPSLPGSGVGTGSVHVVADGTAGPFQLVLTAPIDFAVADKIQGSFTYRNVPAGLHRLRVTDRYDCQTWYDVIVEEGECDLDIILLSLTAPELCETVTGEGCDEGDPNTVNDIVREDCVCRGENPTCGQATTNCPSISSSDLNTIVNEANDVFAQVGITLVNKGLSGNMVVNYDANGDDKLTRGKPPGLANFDEIQKIKNARLSGRDPIDFVEVYIVPELNLFTSGVEGISVGRALSFGGNVLAIGTRGRSSTQIGNTLVHEIGHAVFRFNHPGKEFPGLVDNLNFMFFTADDNGTTRFMKFKERQIGEIHNVDLMQIVKK
jgi:hypothetical protein